MFTHQLYCFTFCKLEQIDQPVHGGLAKVKMANIQCIKIMSQANLLHEGQRSSGGKKQNQTNNCAKCANYLNLNQYFGYL